MLFNTETLKVEAPEAEKTVLTVKTGDQERLIEGSHLLTATCNRSYSKHSFF